MTLRLTLPSGRIAARVDDPLDELLADPALSAARPTALHEHEVRVLPGANPTEEHHIALGAVFGEPEVPQPQHPRHPDRDTICVFDSDGGDKADRWHADETFTDNPCSGAVLTIRIRPDLVYRHRWEDGDVVIWDKRSTQHYAVADFVGRRVVHRVGFVAEPFAA